MQGPRNKNLSGGAVGDLNANQLGKGETGGILLRKNLDFNCPQLSGNAFKIPIQYTAITVLALK